MININGYQLSKKKSLRINSQALLLTIYQHLPSFSHRRFQAYCIGLPRSGTHSIAYILAKNYRSSHEPRSHDTIIHLLQYLNNNYSRKKMEAIIRGRDKFLDLEMESTHYLHYVADLLLKINPKSKFILTIREPFSWLASEINQNNRVIVRQNWDALENFKYSGYNNKFTKEDEGLKAIRNTYPVASYLSYWRDHITEVINVIPEPNLLIINTRKINEDAHKIADFLSIPPDDLNMSRIHSDKKDKKSFDLYSIVNENYVKEQVNKYCSKLADELKPVIGDIL